jgi:integrase
MCGRVIQSSGPLHYALVDGMTVRDSRVHNYPPRWNAAPSQDLLVIRRNHRFLSTRCGGASSLIDHVARHTCAMIILQATQDIRKVSLWLGHATLTTTEIYTRGDPTEKLDAMESIVPPHLRRGAFQPSDKLIALLKRAS